MATIVNNQNQDNQQNQQQQAQKPVINLSTGMGTSAPSSAPSTTGATQGVNSKPASSGSFTNLQSYLGANQGAGQKIANTVSQGVTKDLNTQQSAEDQAAQNFQAAVKNSQNVNQQAQGALNSISNSSLLNSNQASDYLNNTTGSTDNLNTFTGLRTGTTQANAATAATNAGNNAQTALQSLTDAYNTAQNQIQNPSDRYTLLQKYLASPNRTYGSGVSSLDNAFLQRDPTKSLDTLNQQINQDRNNNLVNSGQQITGLNQQSAAAKQQGTDLATSIQNQATNNVNGLMTILNNNIAAVNKDRQAQEDWATQQFNNLKSGTGTVDPKFLSLIGITPGQNTYGALNNVSNISELVNLSPEMAATAAQAATANDASRYAALAQLAGIDPTQYAITGASSLTNPVTRNTATDLNTLINQNKNFDNFLSMLSAVPGANSTVLNDIRNAGSNVFNNLVNSTSADQAYQAYLNQFGAGAPAASSLLNLLQQSGYYATAGAAPSTNVVGTTPDGINLIGPS